MFTMPAKKSLISHFVALILGLLGGFLGHDLSGLQAPVEKAAEQLVGASETPAPAPAPAPAPDAGASPAPAPEAPAPAPEAPAPAPAPAP
jgi:hypothetical protein